MINPTLSELLKKVDNTYTLCNVIGKRARQLVDGAHSLAACNSNKPVLIATNEVSKGKLSYTRTIDGLK